MPGVGVAYVDSGVENITVLGEAEIEQNLVTWCFEPIQLLWHMIED